MKSEKKVIIFDFDGTIADTLDLGIEIFNDLSGKFRYKKISEADRQIFREKTSREIVRSLKVPFISLPFLARSVKRELTKEILNVKPVKGMHDALHELHNEHVTLGILTSNTKTNVEQFLKHNDIAVFDFIATSSLFRKHRYLKPIADKFKINHNQVFYIGDETRDVDAAKQAGVQAIAVTWGVNSRERLQQHNPDYLIDTPQQLVKLMGGENER